MINMLNPNGISLLRVLNGISKGLGIVKQILPIYIELKPKISKIPKVLSVLNNSNFEPIKNEMYHEKSTPKGSNNPTFFL